MHISVQFFWEVKETKDVKEVSEDLIGKLIEATEDTHSGTQEQKWEGGENEVILDAGELSFLHSVLIRTTKANIC